MKSSTPMEVFKNHIKKQKVHTKSVSTINDNKNLFTSLNPITQSWKEGEYKTLNCQSNINDRIKEITTEINSKDIEKFM